MDIPASMTFLQSEPLQCVQAIVHFRLCIRQEHRKLLQSDLQLHLTTFNRFSGSAFYINPPAPIFRKHLTVPLIPNTYLIINSVAVILHCCRIRRQGLRFNTCHIACNLFTKLLMPQKVKVIIFFATTQNYHCLFTGLFNIFIGRLP